MPEGFDNNPATLVAIIVAARKAGNKDLERAARQQLLDRFQITLTFVGAKGGATKDGRRGQQ